MLVSQLIRLKVPNVSLKVFHEHTCIILYEFENTLYDDIFASHLFFSRNLPLRRGIQNCDWSLILHYTSFRNNYKLYSMSSENLFCSVSPSNITNFIELYFIFTNIPLMFSFQSMYALWAVSRMLPEFCDHSFRAYKYIPWKPSFSAILIVSVMIPSEKTHFFDLSAVAYRASQAYESMSHLPFRSFSI